MELDEWFIKQQPRLVPSAGAGLLAGVNELGADDRASRRWIESVAQTWTDLGMASRHLELGDYAGPEALAGHLGLVHGLIDSIGMSLSELRGFFGSTGDPGPWHSRWRKLLAVAAYLCMLTVGPSLFTVTVHGR